MTFFYPILLNFTTDYEENLLIFSTFSSILRQVLCYFWRSVVIYIRSVVLRSVLFYFWRSVIFYIRSVILLSVLFYFWRFVVFYILSVVPRSVFYCVHKAMNSQQLTQYVLHTIAMLLSTVFFYALFCLFFTFCLVPSLHHSCNITDIDSLLSMMKNYNWRKFLIIKPVR